MTSSRPSHELSGMEMAVTLDQHAAADARDEGERRLAVAPRADGGVELVTPDARELAPDALLDSAAATLGPLVLPPPGRPAGS